VTAKPSVIAVCSSPRHRFSKQPQLSIHLLAGLGVQGDAHCGATVQHIYLKKRTPQAPNRMQVHLLASELLHELELQPGQLGENITTQGIDLIHLPLGTRLHIGAEAVVELTGLRSPCVQIEKFKPGLLKRVVARDAATTALARAGVMAIVVHGGEIMPGANLHISLPPEPHQQLTMI